ncbi:uncharacterized protein [Amphiura filiformis]|uniref:uncharacterized protein n=1 Tax=Amphiura filiformis TaxID=82378 RepID=UPI003B21657F
MIAATMECFTARRTFGIFCIVVVVSLIGAGRIPSCVNIACEDDEPGTARCNQRHLRCIPQNHVDAKFLDMHGNSLTSLIEGSFRHMVHLQKLDLSMNKIKSIIPGAFVGLTNLTNLILKFNKLFTINRGTFNGASHLTNLDLSKNNITTIQPGSFDGLQNLKTLFLHENLINRVSDGTLFGLRSLNYLALQNNHIQSLAPRSFHGLTKLQTLQLNGNKLRTLPNFKIYLPSLKNLWVADNNIQCDCRVEFLRRWMNPKNGGVSLTVRHPILCVAPRVLKGRDMRLFGFPLQCVGPSIVKNPKQVMALTGRSLVVPCNATGVPEPTVMWMKPEGSLVTSETNQRVTMTSDGSLRILQARKEDSGNYTCRAQNAGGQDTTSVAVVILDESHVNQDSYNSVTSYEGYDTGQHLPELSYPDIYTTPHGCSNPSATPICDATVGVITTACVTFITTLATCLAFFYIWYKRQNPSKQTGYKEHIDDVDVSCDETPMRHKCVGRRKSKIVSVITAITMPAYMYTKPARPKKKPNRSFRMGSVEDNPRAEILPSVPSCHSVSSSESDKKTIDTAEESLDTDMSYEEGDMNESLDSNNLYENALILTTDPNYSALDPMTRCIMNDTYEETDAQRDEATLL